MSDDLQERLRSLHAAENADRAFMYVKGIFKEAADALAAKDAEIERLETMIWKYCDSMEYPFPELQLVVERVAARKALET